MYPEFLTVILIFCMVVILYLIGQLSDMRKRNERLATLFQESREQIKNLLGELEEEKKSNQLESFLFSEITSILRHVHDSEQSLHSAFSRMMEILSIDFGILLLDDGSKARINICIGTDMSLLDTFNELERRKVVLMDLENQGVPLSFENFQKSRILKIMDEARSLLGFPCKVQTFQFGYFMIGYRVPHQFNQAELDGLKFCADQFAITFQLSKQLSDSQELSQLRHDYIANVSHELRTPLTTIYGYLTILKSYPDSLFQEAEKNEIVSIMTEECQRLMRLINNLLLTVKVEQAEFPSLQKFMVVSVSDIIQHTTRFMEPELKNKNVQIRTDFPAQPALIEGNLDLLQQVFQNLVSNSIKFCSTDPRIEVVVRSEEDQVAIYFSDNGVGIEPEALPNVFQKFYRARSQASHRPGLGIGLFLVQKLVEMHRGTISVTSQVGKGTMFVIRIPKSSVPAAMAQSTVL
ncbi:MAG: HAMP domain-containing sensor histidine kinase [Terriglobia bacterium]